MFGFLVAMMETKYADSFYKEIPGMLARGELKSVILVNSRSFTSDIP